MTDSTKHTIYRAVFSPVEVQLPHECPGCGASFVSDDNNLVERCWDLVNYQACRITEVGDSDGAYVAYAAPSENEDDSMVIAYICGRCQNEVVCTVPEDLDAEHRIVMATDNPGWWDLEYMTVNCQWTQVFQGPTQAHCRKVHDEWIHQGETAPYWEDIKL